MSSPLGRPRARLPVAALAALGFLGGLAGCSKGSETASTTPPGAAGRPATSNVGALGRIEPGDGVVRLGARSISGQPSLIGKLLVREGDEVTAGQIVAETDATVQLEATYKLGEARVELARKNLAQVQAGAKASEIAAQRAEVERLQVELENARKDLRRYENLHKTNATAESALDSARVRAESFAKLLQQANDRLTSLSEPRPVDVDAGKAQVEANVREAARLRAEYEASRIRSPLTGRVLKIHAWPGEEVGSRGVMELAPTEPMYVLAEVAETDMARVKPGQKARITADGLPGTLTGKVEKVGLQVTQNSVLKLDPAEFTDSRVVETRIRLDDGAKVAQLIHMRVKVVIEP